MRSLGPWMLGLLAAALCLGCGGGGDGGAPRNAVLITLDTTRRDALGCYGAPPEITPHLDALARESLVYDDARSVAPITLPAHASMLTGLYPPRHGIRDNQLVPLSDAAVTVAERARDAGFQTAAFVSVVILGDVYGVDQGFERFDQPAAEEDVGRHGAERDGPATVAAAVRWLAARDPERPFLLWVHLFDAHAPNEPPPEHLARAGGNAYLGDVAFQDDAVGTLLDALRADPAWDETLVLVVGDHGEGLEEHGEATHSTFVYDSTLAVPFLLRDPGVEPGRSDEVVSVVDVYPTLIEALGLGAAAGVDGLSLYRRAVPPDRGVYFESYHGLLYFQWSPLAGWADARAKYIHSSSPELYDVRADPGELEDLLPAAPDRAAPYRAALERLAERPALEPGGTVDRAILPSLEDLGYAGSSDARTVPDPLDAGDAPSPHARAAELRAIQVARYHGNRGEYAEAVALLDQVLARDPRNHEAWNRKGAYLMALGRTAEAIAALERFVAIGPDWPNVWVNLAKCHVAEGELEAAETWARRTVEVDPTNRAALTLLVDLLTEAGRAEEAAPFQLRLIDLR